MLNTFLNGKNAKQKILIIFFSFPFSNHFVYYYALYLLFLCFSLCLIFYISEYFPRYSLFCVCVCVYVHVCVICVRTCLSIFFFNSDKSTKLWLNYSALSLIAQLIMDREKKIVLWDVCCELMWNNLVIQHSLGTFIKYWYLWKLEADGKWYGLPRWQ